MKRRSFGEVWREFANDSEAICVLSLSNLVALVLLLILELWLNYGGR
jgi:ABC-type antimicrobial peptide transport system permease subunit